MAVDAETFRRALGSFASTVTVVTTATADGRRFGLTATAFTSVSLAPPLVLVCIDRRSESLPAVRETGVFAVNFLAADEEALSRRFASPGPDKFEGLITERAVTGSPLLPGGVGWVDCRVVQVVDAGDHVVFLGEVEAAAAQPAVEPLLYFRGRYDRLAGLAS